MASHDHDENAVLWSVAEGTASATGEQFFHSLVDNLRTALGTMGAWVAVVDEERGELRALSMRMREQWLDGFMRAHGRQGDRARHLRTRDHDCRS